MRSIDFVNFIILYQEEQIEIQSYNRKCFQRDNGHKCYKQNASAVNGGTYIHENRTFIS